MPDLSRLDPTDYAEYFERYISLVPPGDVLMVLREQIELHLHELGALTEAQADFRYAPGKWSIKEVVGHLSDTERIFAYRAVCFARGEAQPLPGFDQNAYVAAARFSSRSLRSLLEEFRAVRGATLALFGNFDAQALGARGVADSRAYRVRAIPYIIAGHESHHWRVFRDRYVPGIR